MNSLRLSSLFFVILFFLSACSSTQKVTEQVTPAPNRSQIIVNNPLSLADFLIRAPGVYVDPRIGGPRVLVRGRPPLYVVNGFPIGFSYYEANSLVNPLDIERVEVLRGIDATLRFGTRGGNGAILIQTN